MMKVTAFVRRFATSAARLEEAVSATVEKEAVSATVEKDGRSRMQKIVDHFKNILDDYKTVLIETGQDMRARPLKSSVYMSAVIGLGVLFKTNPGEREFHARLTECATDLMMIGEMTRNPHSNEVVTNFKNLEGDNRLRCYNIGVCSLMCVKQFNPKLGLYKARSKYVNPHWTEFFSTIVDVGVLGRWRNLEQAMIDYDIHPDEWLQNGEPNKDFKFFGGNPVSWDMKMKSQ